MYLLDADSTRTRRGGRRDGLRGPRPIKREPGTPYYRTRLGTAWLGDARELLNHIHDESVQAIITSPPFALRTKKRYGNPPEDGYIEWFLPFASEFRRILKPDGSLVIEIGGAWLRGSP